MSSIYQVPIETGTGDFVTWEEFRGKVILVVNTASQCGFSGQYEALQQLHETYYAKGLRVVAFPCNQFGGQEPGSYQEIVDEAFARYGVTFPIYAKVDVSGENQAPIYSYLKSQTTGLTGGIIPWNFTKFLIDKQGNLLDYYYPGTSLTKIEMDIIIALN
ncbi:MAG: glutathione peroxidase [Legionellales bacterium]|nr:glutathione peroxidase [Legionellales bacterium]